MEAARSRDEISSLAEAPHANELPFLQREDSSRSSESPTVVPVLDGGQLGSEFNEAAEAVGAGERLDDSLRPQVEEMLICSLQGEVHHEWQCPNTTGRVSLLEFVSQKARQLAQQLPVGTFDRLEVNAAESRVIAQIQPERAMYLRLSRVQRNAADSRKP